MDVLPASYSVIILAFLLQATTAVKFNKDLCQNETGVLEYSEPVDTADIISWELQRNCSTDDSAVVIQIEELQLQSFEGAAAVLKIQNHCIVETEAGTCYVFQRNYSTCGNVVNEHKTKCKKFVWIYGDSDPIIIDLQKVLTHPVSVKMNYMLMNCDTGKGSSILPIATIILGVLLGIVIILLLVMVIRKCKQTAIQMASAKKSELEGFESFEGEYDEDPYQHYQVPNNRPLEGYEPTLKPVEEGIYEVPSSTPLNQGLPDKKEEGSVIYAKPDKETPAGYGSVEY